MHVSFPGRKGVQTRGQTLSLNSCLPPLLSSPQMIRNMFYFTVYRPVKFNPVTGFHRSGLKLQDYVPPG